MPDRIEAIRSLDYEKEIEDALSLIRLCKTINKFTQETVSKKMFEEREKLQKTLFELSTFWNDLNKHISEDSKAQLNKINLHDVVNHILSL